jgi:acetate kinase
VVNVLVLIPHQRNLQYTYYERGRRAPVVSVSTPEYGSVRAESSPLADLLQRAGETCGINPRDDLAIALRGTFGGAAFRRPTLATDETTALLRDLAPQAPLHVPPLIGMAAACHEVFPSTPLVMAFETAFFAALPPREHSYGLDPALMQKWPMRRYGYHGILHEAACAHLNRSQRGDGLEAASRRILSICLEPKPEIAAVIGRRPVMVTSGATPLEGLPGQTSCGELDPSIVLALAETRRVGPEQMNDVLTRQSGLLGLTGKHVSLEQVLASPEPEMRQAAQLMRYRILQSCGAGMAATGGVDGIVFSGRYAHLGETLGPWLAQRLAFKGNPQAREIAWEVFSEPRTRILADMAFASASMLSASATAA